MTNDSTILIPALVKFMQAEKGRCSIVKQTGYASSDVWKLFLEIASNNQTLSKNLYNNIKNFYDSEKQCLDFTGKEEQIYETSNYELYLKEVLKFIEAQKFTNELLSDNSWKTTKSIEQVVNQLRCIYGKNNKIQNSMVTFMYGANEARINKVHHGQGNNNELLQIVLVAMYIATSVAKRLKEEKVVAGIWLKKDPKVQSKGKYYLSSKTLPQQAKIDLRAKKILFTETMFAEQNTFSFQIEINEGKKLTFQKQVEVKRGDFLCIKYSPKAALPEEVTNIPSKQTKAEQPKKKEQEQEVPITARIIEQLGKLKQTPEPQKEHHKLSKWFAKFKKRIRQPAILLGIIISICVFCANTTTLEIQTEELQEVNLYPCLDGAWLVTTLQDSQSLGVAEIRSDNEYGTKGRMAIMLHESGEQVVYNFTLNRNTGELKLENYQTQIETINKIVKLRFKLQEWKLEKYNL